MDYEKMYKEALERAKKFEEKYGGGYAGYIFPELAESEDERVRRELIEYLRGDLDDITTDDTDRWITWIEKQEDCILVPKSHFDPVGKPGVDGMKILEKQKELKPAEVCYGPKGDPDPAGVWKPSEEEIRVYEDAISCIPDFYKPKSTLEALLEQLKKL